MEKIQPLTPAKPRLITTGNNSKIYCINPDSQEIIENSMEISDKDSFVSFCRKHGLGWFFEYWPDLRKFSESMGEYIAYGKSDYIEAARIRGLVVGRIGDATYIIAKKIPIGSEKNFCTSRNFNKQIFWGSALIFSIETFYPGGYTVMQQQEKTIKPTLYNQRDCYLSLDQVDALFDFSCEPVENSNIMELSPKDSVDNKKDLVTNKILKQVASMNEDGQLKEDASVKSIGIVLPGTEPEMKLFQFAIPLFYGDVLIELGKTIKGEPSNFFNIPFDMTLKGKTYILPEYVASIIKDLAVKVATKDDNIEKTTE